MIESEWWDFERQPKNETEVYFIPEPDLDTLADLAQMFDELDPAELPPSSVPIFTIYWIKAPPDLNLPGDLVTYIVPGFPGQYI